MTINPKVSDYFLNNGILASKAKAVSTHRLSVDLGMTDEKIYAELNRHGDPYLPWGIPMAFTDRKFIYNDLGLRPIRDVVYLFAHPEANPRKFYQHLKMALTGEAFRDIPYLLEELVKVVGVQREARDMPRTIPIEEFDRFNDMLYFISISEASEYGIDLRDFLLLCHSVRNLTEESKETILQLDTDALPERWKIHL